MKNKNIIVVLLVLIGLGATTVGAIFWQRKKKESEDKREDTTPAAPLIEVVHLDQDNYELDVRMRYQGIEDTLQLRDGILPNKQYGSLTFRLEAATDQVTAIIKEEDSMVLEKVIPFDAYREEVQTVKTSGLEHEVIEVSSTNTMISDQTTKVGANDQKVRGGVL